MTKHEATIVSAYTGYFIGGLDGLYKYLSDWWELPEATE